MSLAALAAASIVLVPIGGSAETITEVRAGADFLLSLALPGGAIASDITRDRIEPYVANHAAWGLARAAALSGDGAYRDAAAGWLSWYQSQMDGAGVVHDYVVVGGVPHPTPDEDSVDATSGVFLLAVRELLLATPVASRQEVVERYRGGIVKAVNAIEALRDVDGLTWAKSTWHVKYLMDNAEAYGGLVASGDLARALGDPLLQLTTTVAAVRAKAGLLSLWNGETQAYDWAVHENGFRQKADWSVLYPDAVEQAWTVAFGISDVLRSGTLMRQLELRQPDWYRPTAMATYWDGTPYRHPVEYWPIVGWGFQAAGRADIAAAGAAVIAGAARDAGRRPPFTAATQGQLLLLQTGGRQVPRLLASQLGLS